LARLKSREVTKGQDSKTKCRWREKRGNIGVSLSLGKSSGGEKRIRNNKGNQVRGVWGKRENPNLTESLVILEGEKKVNSE